MRKKSMVSKLLFPYMKEKPIMSSLRTRFGSVRSASETYWEYYILKKPVFYLVKTLKKVQDSVDVRDDNY